MRPTSVEVYTATATVNAAAITAVYLIRLLVLFNLASVPRGKQVSVASLPASHGLRDHKLLDAAESAYRLVDDTGYPAICLRHMREVASESATYATMTNFPPSHPSWN